MNRKFTDKEIKKAQELYLMQSKPLIERLNEIHQYLTPKIIQTESEVKVYYEETEEIVSIRKKLDELSNKMKTDLISGKFL